MGAATTGATVTTAKAGATRPCFGPRMGLLPFVCCCGIGAPPQRRKRGIGGDGAWLQLRRRGLSCSGGREGDR